MKYLLICVLLFSCNFPKKRPFVIVDKTPSNNSRVLDIYRYSDADGVTTTFYDTSGKYNIGDTLK